MGVYYLETGAVQRPSKVIYDREGSVFCNARPGDFDWDSVFEGASWFHITGITPAVSEGSAELSLEAVREAKKRGLQVSCDLNYRSNLWKYGKPPEQVMVPLVRYVDTLIANEGHFRTMLGLRTDEVETVRDGRSDEQCRAIADLAMEAYPNLRRVLLTQRESISASHNDWSALLYNGKELLHSRKYAITDIVDRVGGGDSLDAGLIYGLSHYGDEKTALEFAVAASCLKHTIPGDYNRCKVSEVEALMNGSGSGKVQR